MNVKELNKEGNTHVGRQLTWNKLKDILPLAGYKVETETKRINGSRKICYKITGDWKYVEVENNSFLTLATAKEKDFEKKSIDFSPSGEVSYNPELEIPDNLKDVVWTH